MRSPLSRTVVSGFLLFLASGLPALSVDEPEQPPSAWFHSQIERRGPNQLLSGRIDAPENEVTLYADFANTDDTGVPIYIINRTGRSINYDVSDGRLCLHLEFETADGGWQRAQAHSDSFCGNSYGFETLRAGQFWLVRGYQPAAGTPATVRFNGEGGGLGISNSGPGFVNSTDIRFSQVDDLEAQRVPFPLLSIPGLLERGLPAWNERVAVLRLIALWEENTYYRRLAEKLMEEARLSPAPEGSRAADAINEILAKPWSETADAATFIRECLTILQASPHAGDVQEFGSLHTHRSIVWRALGALASRSFDGHPGGSRWPTSLETWRPAVLLAKQEFLSQPGEGSMGLLAVDRLADEFVEDRIFEEGVRSADRSIRMVSAKTLARRESWKALVLQLQ